MGNPSWLPELLLLSDSGNDWNVYLKIVYLMFSKDFLESLPKFMGQELRLKRDPMRDGKEATFWHLISEGADESTRTPNEARCERIRWPRPAIERVPCTELTCWESHRGGEKRIVIALDDYSYVVVLACRKGYLLPWTAYPVERDHRREKLRKEHNSCKKITGAATL